MQRLPLILFDETLRDGEQQAGLFFSYETKKTLAHLIAKTGVRYLDIMPAIDETEDRLVKTLVGEGLKTLVTPATMMGKSFIDQSKACGVERIILFHAISDRLLFLRDQKIRRSAFFQGKTVDDHIPEAVIRKVRQNAAEKILENLRYATSADVGLKVEFAAEDASRADINFLVHCIREFRPYIGHFMLCDTVGILSPDKTYDWIHDLLQATDYAPLAVHFHNDLGMALENTIQAVVAGATMVSGTFSGIGERAGNVALEQVLNGLKVRFGIEVEEINYTAVTEVTDYLAKLGVRSAAPYSPAAQRHATGIHVNSILQDRKSYSTFAHEKPEIWFGKCSGASNFQYLFEKDLGRPLSRNEYSQMRSHIKTISTEQECCFSAEQVVELFEQGAFNNA